METFILRLAWESHTSFLNITGKKKDAAKKDQGNSKSQRGEN